jgi:hypothetical protein
MDVTITSRATAQQLEAADARDLRLSRPVSLMLIVAASLGLWAAIWAAGTALVSALNS